MARNLHSSGSCISNLHNLHAIARDLHNSGISSRSGSRVGGSGSGARRRRSLRRCRRRVLCNVGEIALDAASQQELHTATPDGRLDARRCGAAHLAPVNHLMRAARRATDIAIAAAANATAAAAAAAATSAAAAAAAAAASGGARREHRRGVLCAGQPQPAGSVMLGRESSRETPITESSTPPCQCACSDRWPSTERSALIKVPTRCAHTNFSLNPNTITDSWPSRSSRAFFFGRPAALPLRNPPTSGCAETPGMWSGRSADGSPTTVRRHASSTLSFEARLRRACHSYGILSTGMRGVCGRGAADAAAAACTVSAIDVRHPS
eukprot:364011-Chlamydomonas_euryale.AAC.12